MSPRRAAANENARWRPVFFISLLMLVIAIGLFTTAGDGAGRLSAAGIFVAAAAMLFVAARNGKPRG